MYMFPYFLFKIPSEGTDEFKQLVSFIESHKQEIIAFFPWFTAEMLEACGTRATVSFLAENASKRISVDKIFEIFPNHGKAFKHSIEINCTDGEYIELQSSTGFFDTIRRYYIHEKLKLHIPNIQIATSSGSSIRRIQRIKKRSIK